MFLGLLLYIVWSALVLVNAQTSTSTRATPITSNTSAQPSPSNVPDPRPGCDPTMALCENPDCSRCPAGGDSTICNPTDTGVLQYHSPSTRSFYYLQKTINITWSYEKADNGMKYISRRGNFIYYQRIDDDKWTLLANVSASTFTYIWNLKGSLLLPANYRIRVLPDDIDQSGTVGHAVSCLPNAFPLSSGVLFRLLPIPDLTYNPDKDNAGQSLSLRTFFIGFTLFGLFILI